jgi:hypothetical protein
MGIGVLALSTFLGLRCSVSVSSFSSASSPPFNVLRLCIVKSGFVRSHCSFGALISVGVFLPFSGPNTCSALPVSKISFASALRWCGYGVWGLHSTGDSLVLVDRPFRLREDVLAGREQDRVPWLAKRTPFSGELLYVVSTCKDVGAPDSDGMRRRDPSLLCAW